MATGLGCIPEGVQMKRVIEAVIPVGTPWGGPESRRYLSAFVSQC